MRARCDEEEEEEEEEEGSSLPRPSPCGLGSEERPQLHRKTREQEGEGGGGGGGEDEPPRPHKRSTPRPSAPTLLFHPKQGTFVMHRVPTLENISRGNATTSSLSPMSCFHPLTFFFFFFFFFFFLKAASVFTENFSDPRRLGSGSFGTVFDAKYALNGQRYAVKIFNRKGDSETKNEVAQVSFLQAHPHPNCLTYFFAWTDKKFDEYGIVTEMCTGGSLKVLLHAQLLSEARVWQVFLDLLHGLAHIHANNLRHLDIKPENLFLTGNGVLRIGDFGLASHVNE